VLEIKRMAKTAPWSPKEKVSNWGAGCGRREEEK
jgi:hypothetical protein